jgi:ABC-type antimicrobial peptide transport system permease subunit
LLLKKGVDPHRLEAKIPSMLKKYEVEGKAKHAYLLQPLGEMHSDERFGNYRGRFMPKENINGLILIGLFILVIASINFINLATAQSVRRSKEVGIRKVIGSTRRQILVQFMGETFVSAITAMLLSLIIAFLTLPYVNTFLDSKIAFSLFQDSSILIFIGCITLAVTVLAGFYPAFIISGFRPILALKNKITAPAAGVLSLRRGLIVAQFIIAQLLIVGTLVVFNQLEYLQNKPVGYNKEGLMIVTIPESIDKAKRNSFRTQVMALPDVKNVSYSLIPPSSEGNWSAGFNYSGSGLKDDISCIMYPIDEHYIKTYNIELLAGRGLRDGDSNSVVVNEVVLQKMNIKTPEEAIGTQIIQFNKPKSIVGVVKNFNTQSVKKATEPIVMLYMDWVFVGGVKIGLQNIKGTVDRIEQIWKRMFPETLFEFSFLDEQIAKFYIEEVKVFKLLRVFAAIAILISCLGLYGLVSFMAVQRTKEIGIRKVLGASPTHIVNLFAKEFVVLILIAFIIAAPIAWYALHAWLTNYENKTNVGADSFLIALVFSLVLAGCTILYRSLRAAYSNTVRNIRTE